MKAAWLLRDGTVLAAAEVADSFVGRARGLIGRDGIEGALVLPRVRAVHTLGMRFPIDVAFLDAELVVLEMVSMSPWRLGRPRLGARSVLEAPAGSFERWGLRPGDRLELRLCE
jgi:uncharacterized membrane protein (UPF0127 family)